MVIQKDQDKVENYSLIFMDCNMPIMDGYTSTTLIKQYLINNKLQDIPIIAVTVYKGV